MKMGIPIPRIGLSWLYEQVLYMNNIPLSSGYIDARLVDMKDKLNETWHDAGTTRFMLGENSIIQIDKRCVDVMNPMPDTFGGKWKE